MKRGLNQTDVHTSDLHASLIRILPPLERTQFCKLCNQTCILRYPALNLSACSRIKTIMTPATDSTQEWPYDNEIGAHVDKKLTEGNESIIQVRAILVGKLTSSRSGLLRIHDCSAATSIAIAPSPPPSMRNTYIYAVNWRYIPKQARSKGYFEVLRGDIILLTPRNILRNSHTTPAHTDSTSSLTSLSAQVTAKSCIIATRKQSCCFLVELSGISYATVVVFCEDAVAWWPFLCIGSEITVHGLRLCSLPRYNRRTVFLASDSTMIVESGSTDKSMASKDLPNSKRQRVACSNSTDKPVVHCQLKERIVNYEGLITEILADGRFKLDHRLTFHPGPIHAFSSEIAVSSILRRGTKIKVLNSHLLQTYDAVRLFPTAKSSIEVLYFGELKTIHSLTDGIAWRQSGWDRLWKRLDSDDVLWAEGMYDMLAKKFWHWLRGSSQPVAEATDSDRIACLLGDQNDVGLVQYVMHLLSGREELFSQDGGSRRDIYKEFLEPPGLGCNRSQIWFASVPTLKQLKEMVLMSEVNGEDNSTEPSMNRVDVSPLQEDICMLHHSQIGTDRKSSSKKDTKRLQQHLRLVLSGVLHVLELGRDRFAISDATVTLPVRIIGMMDPALIGAVILVTNYYMIIDFRGGEHESVTAVFTTTAVKTIVDGPYAEMGGSATAGPLVYESQSLNRTRQIIGGKRPGSGVLEGSILLTRRTWNQGTRLQDSREGSLRIADVPMISVFVETVRTRGEGLEISGKLIAIRQNHGEENWEIVLRDEERKLFWDCKLILSGDTGIEISSVIQENRVWSISCNELSGVDDIHSYIWNKVCGDSELMVMLSSTFNRIVPWVEDLCKGEYMRYLHVVSNTPKNLSMMSTEGVQYNVVRDAVERFSTQRQASNVIWKLYNERDGSIVNMVGTVVKNYLWEGARLNSEWTLTLRDEDAIFSLSIDFSEYRSSICGISPGMRVIIRNILCVRPTPWGRCTFKASVDTIVRVLSIGNKECRCKGTGYMNDYKVLRGLPRLNLVDFENGHSSWVGFIEVDVIEIMEIQVCKRRCCGKEVLIMTVTLSIEDGTTKGILHCEGLERCCAILGLSSQDCDTISAISRHQVASIDKDSAVQFGLPELFGRKGFGRFGCVVCCEARVVGGEVLMKCFPLGFGQRVWTACRQDLVRVWCVGVFRDGIALLRNTICEIEDGLGG